MEGGWREYPDLVGDEGINPRERSGAEILKRKKKKEFKNKHLEVEEEQDMTAYRRKGPRM